MNKEQIRDLFETLTPQRIDGLFLDIVKEIDCSCKHCVDTMKKLGYHPENYDDRAAYARKMLAEFKLDMTDYLHTFKKDLSIYYNAGHFSPECIDSQDAFSHWELESLPSGEWGYTHFVNTIRFARTTGIDCVGQTGKFHTAWGDFHSFKNVEALRYECLRMLAYNSKCMIGDQLDPDGKISKAVYDIIGEVYCEVEKKEPWCENAQALIDIGVFTSECLQTQTGGDRSVPKNVAGACTMLDEMGYQFDIVETRTDLSKYKVLILPDNIICTDELQGKFESYVKKGGKLIATAKSGLNEAEDTFALDCLGLSYVGKAPFSPDFIMPNDIIGKELPKTEHVMYDSGIQVEANRAEVLAMVAVPYFNRTYEHFCSHKHTPSAHKEQYPGVLKNNNCIYFMHPVFSTYHSKHPRWCKKIIQDALDILLPNPILRHNGPTTLTATVNEQKKENRYIFHGLHFIPVKNCEELDTIEDIIPLYNITSAAVVPEGKPLDFKIKDSIVELRIPEIYGHVMIELKYD